MKRPAEYASLLDMVFEGREKTYGAYPLRKHQPWFLFTAFAVVGGLFLATAFAVVTWGGSPSIQSPSKSDIRDCWLLDPPQLIYSNDFLIPEKKFPEFRTPLVRKRERIEGPKVIPLPPDPGKVLLQYLEQLAWEETDTTLAETYNIIYESHGCRCSGGHIDIPGEYGDGEPVIIEEDPDWSSFIFDDELPKALNLDDFRKLIGFPDFAYRRGKQGKIIFRLLIDKGGHYRSHTVIRCDNPVFLPDAEKHLPMLRFTPAVKKGKPVLCKVDVPIYFKLLE